MSTTSTPTATPIQYINQNPIFTKPCRIKTQALLFHKPTKSSSLHSKCTNTSNNNSSQENGSSNNSSLKDALSGIVNEQVEELLNREENKGLLDELEKASERVEIARRELALIERQELEAKELRNYVSLLETKAAERYVEENRSTRWHAFRCINKIEECQCGISEAKAMVAEAERSLSLDTNEEGDRIGKESKGINRDEERLESAKAATISTLIGTLAGLPICITQVSSYTELILPSAITFISCALFGVTFRYVVRRDLDNFQLKSGTCAAFGFVQGLGALSGGPPLELNIESFVLHGFDGAVCIAENLLIFGFAAVSLDLSFKVGVLSPFPMSRSASRIDSE